MGPALACRGPKLAYASPGIFGDVSLHDLISLTHSLLSPFHFRFVTMRSFALYLCTVVAAAATAPVEPEVDPSANHRKEVAPEITIVEDHHEYAVKLECEVVHSSCGRTP
jgi:hypothetical protein